jgi:hypothetical protein
MRPPRLLLPILAIVTLAVTALVVRDLRAADKAGIQKIVDLIKAGKNDDAKAAAKAYAAKSDDLEDLMAGFSRKNGLIPGGIEVTLRDFEKRGVAAGDLMNPNFQDLGATTSAIALVCDAVPAPKGQKGTPAEWTAFAKDMSAKGDKFQAAFKMKLPAAIQSAATAANASCANCHSKFRP